MKINLVTENEDAVLQVEITPELTIEIFRSYVEIETGISAERMILTHKMVALDRMEKTLGDYNIEDGDIILVSLAPAATRPTPQTSQPIPMDFSAITIPSSTQSAPPPPVNPDDPEVIRQSLINNPSELAALQQRNPTLHAALLNPDPSVFRQVLEQHIHRVREAERERIQIINADPFDPEAQAKIAQDIEQRNIEENMTTAIEYTPESFSRVVMLYVHLKVNGVPVKALVDSGARASIMSENCAQRCNVMRLVDRRFAGVAFGIGRQTIIGKVHLVQVQLGQDYLTSSFSVLKDQAEDMLLGLDMLRRHQCSIDLKDDVLRIGTTGNSVAFLKESDLKEKEEMERQQAVASVGDEDSEMAKAIAESQANAPQTSPPQLQHSAPEFPESSVRKIMEAGFSREQAIESLRENQGNTQQALVRLLASSIQL